MLSIKNVYKTYPGGVRALDDVSLEVTTGLFGLLGPNGSGKSTLMRTLATLQEPDQGQVLFAERDIFAHAQEHRQRLGYLPQDFGVYPGVSALRLLDHLAVLKGVDAASRKQQIAQVLERTHLYEHRKRAVSQFSGGMKRRFGIAQALLGNPRLLIVDEPTAGLDPEERHRFHDFLQEVGERIVIVLSTHIVEDVRQLCPRVAILHGGRVRAEGKPAELIEELRGKVWQRTVDRQQVAQYRQSENVLSTRLMAGRTQLRVLAEERPDPDFEALEPDLEDVYFSVLSAETPVRGEAA